MIIKEDGQKLQLTISKKSQIKYVILLITSLLLFIFYCFSFFKHFFGNNMYFGMTLSDLLTRLTFFIASTSPFIGIIIIAIFGSLKTLMTCKKIIFDNANKETLFKKERSLFKKITIKKIPFSEISEIKVAQEKDSDYVMLSISHENKEIQIDSDYGMEGMERLNELGERIRKLIEAPLQKGSFEDIYIEEEEENEKKRNK